MLSNLSLIPTNVREGFDVQDLPPRASTVSEEQMSRVFGGNHPNCSRGGQRCLLNRDCCSKKCIRLTDYWKPTWQCAAGSIP
jgi:hypothetical protein